MPEPRRFVSDPPVTVTLAAVKLVDASLSAKETVAVSPILRAGLLVAMTSVGAMVSIERGWASWPAMLPLPVVSVNALAATEIWPGVVEVTAGVKTAE